MSTIKNPNATKGSVVTHTELNQKFSDITTATTGGLDDLNVRSEAIDCNNIDAPPTSGQGALILKDMGTHENGSRPAVGGAAAVAMTVYNSTEGPGPGPVVINHGPTTGTMVKTFVIKAGDVLRVQWQVWVEDYPTHGGRAWGDTNPAHLITYTQPKYPCWMVWLQWNVPASGAWQEVPSQTDFDVTYGSDKGGPTSETGATMVVPHGTLYFAWNPAALPIPAASSSWFRERGRTYRQSWNYVHTGADITITGLRLMIDGLYHPRNEAATGDVNVFNHENRDWSGAPFVATNNQITLGTVNIVAIHMEKD